MATLTAVTGPAPEPVSGPGSGPTRRRGLHFTDVHSADGTRLRAWSNDAAGPTVLLCNGLGTNPYAWPALLDPDCGVHVVSWQHRGVGGSERPRDRSACGVEQLVEDAVAVMDAHGIDRAPVLGWSIGVNTAFELAVRHPDRVSGLFAVAGVPGRTFATMLRPFGLPRFVNEVLAVNLARALKYAGPALSPVATRLPVGPRAIRALGHTGFMMPVADPDATASAVRDFLTTPMDWYFHCALRAHRHQRVPLAEIDVPTAFVAGRRDLLAGARDMATAADRVAGASFTELDGTHFLTLEQPDRVHELLLGFLARMAAG